MNPFEGRSISLKDAEYTLTYTNVHLDAVCIIVESVNNTI